MRTKAEEVAVWKRRLVNYLQKEARCPKCIQVARLAEGTILPKVCEYHLSARFDLATD
jgi:hypothetical protein